MELTGTLPVSLTGLTLTVSKYCCKVRVGQHSYNKNSVINLGN